MTEHQIVYVQEITPVASEAVCCCGAVMNSYGSTVAKRFGEHIRYALATRSTESA